MMPGIGFEEMILLVVVAIVVIGPKDLPLMMRKFGQFTGKMRAMAFEFKQGFDELGRQAELDELKREVANLKKATGLDELRQEFAADSADIHRDVAKGMAEAEAKPEPPTPAPYAGLSPEHPGYDTGADAQVNGAPTPPAAPGGAAVEAGEPHIIPDDEVRPAPMHPAMAMATVKQDAPA